jgi:small subunit ribosomal protein S6e
MASFKIVISDSKTGKSEVMEAKDSQAQIIDLSVIGQNYKVKLTGGSDRAGFPMRGDVMGSGKRHVLMTEGIGFRHSVQGEKRRKLVRGGTVTEEVYQLNVVRSE